MQSSNTSDFRAQPFGPLSAVPPAGHSSAQQPVIAALPRRLPPRRAASPSLSCVVPCFNEARNLELLVPVLQQVLARLAEHWEIILVDDGSRDDSEAVIEALARQSGVRALMLARNFGKEAALTAGMQAAEGDVVILMDADLQHPPQFIPAMLEQWRLGADMVYAVHAGREGESWLKRTGTRLTYALLNHAASRVRVPENAGDFRLMDRRVVEAVLALPERNRFMKGLYAWVGFETVGLEYQPPPRACGTTRFRLRDLLGLALDGITAFTTWPLRLVSLLGALLAVPSFLYGGYLVGAYFFYAHPVSGWTTIVVCLQFFFGMQMLSLGILGEYISRIFEEVKGRPVYLVRHEIGTGLTPVAR